VPWKKVVDDGGKQEPCVAGQNRRLRSVRRARQTDEQRNTAGGHDAQSRGSPVESCGKRRGNGAAAAGQGLAFDSSFPGTKIEPVETVSRDQVEVGTFSPETRVAPDPRAPPLERARAKPRVQDHEVRHAGADEVPARRVLEWIEGHRPEIDRRGQT